MSPTTTPRMNFCQNGFHFRQKLFQSNPGKMEEEEEDEVSPEKLRKVVFMGKEKKGQGKIRLNYSVCVCLELITSQHSGSGRDSKPAVNGSILKAGI